MTRKEALQLVERAFAEVYPEMTAEETCDSLEKICEVLEWLIRKIPMEDLV